VIAHRDRGVALENPAHDARRRPQHGAVGAAVEGALGVDHERGRRGGQALEEARFLLRVEEGARHDHVPVAGPQAVGEHVEERRGAQVEDHVAGPRPAADRPHPRVHHALGFGGLDAHGAAQALERDATAQPADPAHALGEEEPGRERAGADERSRAAPCRVAPAPPAREPAPARPQPVGEQQAEGGQHRVHVRHVGAPERADREDQRPHVHRDEERLPEGAAAREFESATGGERGAVGGVDAHAEPEAQGQQHPLERERAELVGEGELAQAPALARRHDERADHHLAPQRLEPDALREPEQRREQHQGEAGREAEALEEPAARVAARGEGAGGHATGRRDAGVEPEGEREPAARPGEDEAARAAALEPAREERERREGEHEVAVAEEVVGVVGGPPAERGEERRKERPAGRHEPAGEPVEAEAERDREGGVDRPRHEEAGRVEEPADPGGEQVPGREDEEDVVVEGAPGVQAHRGIERPALVHQVQAVPEEERLEGGARREDGEEVPREPSPLRRDRPHRAAPASSRARARRAASAPGSASSARSSQRRAAAPSPARRATRPARSGSAA
jgi:hypothetical protein